MGHWQRDPVCPNRRKGKGKGYGGKKGGKGKHGKKGDTKDGGKGRLDSVQQREMEAEVARLMGLPQHEIDQLLAQELAFMPPTSKATMPVRPAPVLQGPSSVLPAATSTTTQAPPPKAIMPPSQHCEQGEAPMLTSTW